MEKQMQVFNVDLDNTLIYSYKHDIGEDKINVEIYQGREISFVTPKTHELLGKVREKVLVVPTTTRTKEQYDRIDLKTGPFKYALVCNGGLLLIDGKSDEQWYLESKKLIEESRQELLKSQEYLEEDDRRTFEVRFIEELFIFTKCQEPEDVVEDLKAILDTELVDVFNNGIKVYVVPKKLSKGHAVMRFKEYIKADEIVAAGDSEFDVSMVEAADTGIVPEGFVGSFSMDESLMQVKGQKLFSEELLEYIDREIL